MGEISLSVNSNVKPFLKGITAVEKSLTDVGSSLGDLSKDAARNATKIGDAIGDKTKDGTRDAERYVDDLASRFDLLTREVKADTQKAGDAIGRNMKEGTDKATSGIQDIKDESASVAKETAASFDGSAESIVQSFKDIAANAFAGFGPAGLIAGVAAAAGIGLVTAEFTKQEEEADKLEERFGSMYQEAIEEGRNFLSESQIIAAGIDLMWNPERVEEYKKVQEEAATLGLDINTAIRARSGDEEANNEIIAAGKKLLEDVGSQLTDNDKINDAAAGKRFGEINEAIDGNRKIAGELDKNKARVAETNALLRDGSERQRDTTAATRDTGGAIDDVAGKLAGIRDRNVNLKVTTPDVNAIVDAMQRRFNERTVSVYVSARDSKGTTWI